MKLLWGFELLQRVKKLFSNGISSYQNRNCIVLFGCINHNCDNICTYKFSDIFYIIKFSFGLFCVYELQCLCGCSRKMKSTWVWSL